MTVSPHLPTAEPDLVAALAAMQDQIEVLIQALQSHERSIGRLSQRIRAS